MRRASAGPSMLILLWLVALVPATLVLGRGEAQPAAGDASPAPRMASDTTPPASPDLDLPPEQAALVAEGAALYALNCAVCHGRDGGGLAEAKLAFPEDHRTCTRCHRPTNRAVQPLSEPFIDNDMFSIGEPPSLQRPDGFAAVAAPRAIVAYIAATMPRYDPGRLSEDEYRAITAHLLALNGRTGELAGLTGAAGSDR